VLLCMPVVPVLVPVCVRVRTCAYVHMCAWMCMKERERETDKKSKCIYEHKIRERGERDERKAQNQGERNKKRRETRERDNKKKRQPDEDEKRESHPFPPRSPSSNISCLSPYCSLERV